MVESYSKFAKYYDKLMSDPKDKVNLIDSWIKKYHPQAKSVLEIACGTGAILNLLKNKYDVTGLDLSKAMIEIAKKKIPSVKFHNKDMTNFKLDQKMDIILCIFDSINHLQNFKDWQKVFNNVKTHLNENGLFIFDFNTINKFDRFGKAKNVFLNNIGKDFVIEKTSVFDKNKVVFYQILFEHQNKNHFKYYEEKVIEAVFEKDKIVDSLYEYFKVLLIFDPKRKRPSKNSERLYFVCKLR